MAETQLDLFPEQPLPGPWERPWHAHDYYDVLLSAPPGLHDNHVYDMVCYVLFGKFPCRCRSGPEAGISKPQAR